jgi:hypothetical protein
MYYGIDPFWVILVIVVGAGLLLGQAVRGTRRASSTDVAPAAKGRAGGILGLGPELGRPLGIALFAIGLLVGAWALMRMNSVEGSFHTWSPPFTNYELMTFLGGGIAVVLLIGGIAAFVATRPHKS